MSKNLKNHLSIIIITALLTIIFSPFHSEKDLLAKNIIKESPIFGYVVLYDIKQTLKNIEQAGKTLDKNDFSAAMLTMTLGMMVGDSKLQNLNSKKPVVALLHKPINPKSKTPIPILYLTVKKPDSYKRAFTMRGFQTFFKNGILLAAKTKEALNLGRKSLKVYNKISKVKKRFDLSINFNFKAIMSYYGPSIDSMLKTLHEKVKEKAMSRMGKNKMNKAKTPEEIKNEETQKKISKIYLHGIVKILKQTKSFQLNLAIKKTSILYQSNYSARKGTMLYKLLNPKLPADIISHTFLSPDGFFSGVIYYDPAAYSNFIVSLFDSIVKHDKSLREILNDGLKSQYSNLKDWWSGETSFTFGINKDSRLSIETIAGITDEAKCLENLEKSISLLLGNTLFLQNKNEMGISDITFSKNSRIYKGLNIHRFLIKIDFTKISKEDADFVRGIIGEQVNYEVAITNGYLLGSIRSEKLDKMIERIQEKNGTNSLQAIKTYGKGKDSYSDVDLASLLKSFKILVNKYNKKEIEKNLQVQKFVNLVDGSKPADYTLLLVNSSKKGSSVQKYYIPLTFIGKIIKLINEEEKKKQSEKKRKKNKV